MEKVMINVPLELAKAYGFENGLQLEEDDFRDALQIVVDDAKNLVDSYRKDGKSIKSNPLVNLIDAKLFSVDVIIEEMAKIADKASELPSGPRKVMKQAFEMAFARVLQKASEELEEKMKSETQKQE